ncbi:MAG: hypothetical protein WC796_01430 [Candidatus Pacearchaeota archaeon]|jgi:predicted transcriptional regulator with HTH domain
MKISDKKKEKIGEQILSVLYEAFPNPIFTSQIAREIARDEEFVKVLLLNLQKKDLVISVTKNQEGTVYTRRIRWRLSNKAHSAYSSMHKPLN